MRGWWVLVLGACSFDPALVDRDGTHLGESDAAMIDAAEDTSPAFDGAFSALDATPVAIDAGCLPRAAVDACLGIVDLGEVSGDAGSDEVISHGHSSASFHLRVREDYGGAFEADPIAQIDLDSPPAADFDLHVFCFGACGGTPIATSEQGPGQRDSVGVGQSDAPGIDNGFELWIEVSDYGGSDCGDWTLAVHGNRATSPVSCY